MSKLRRVTLIEFQLLIKFAQQQHEALNEPIPQMEGDSIDKVDSCLKTPFFTFEGSQLCKGFYQKAALLFYLLCKNHPLPNGNKRMACFTTAHFFRINGYRFDIHPITLYELAHLVTTSDSEEKDEMLSLIKTKLKPGQRKAITAQDFLDQYNSKV